MSSTLSTDQKINMSLDDIVKLKSAEAKKKPAKKQLPRRQSKPTNNQNSTRPPANAKIAQSVGATKAKRNANVNQRRGINQTGKATKSEINNAVFKAGQKKAPRPNSASSNGSALAKLGGLKISFKPKELNKTTEKAVSQQIRAVLAKQPSPRANSNNTNRTTNTNRNVIVKSPRGPARGNPKRRGGGRQ